MGCEPEPQGGKLVQHGADLLEMSRTFGAEEDSGGASGDTSMR